MRDIANLYDCDASLAEIEHYRSTLDTGALSSKCFKSSNVSAVLIDDGLHLDKMYDLEWHKNVIPNVYRVLRIERLAEDILNEVLNIPIHYLNTKCVILMDISFVFGMGFENFACRGLMLA